MRRVFRCASPRWERAPRSPHNSAPVRTADHPAVAVRAVAVRVAIATSASSDKVAWSLRAATLPAQAHRRAGDA